MYWSMISALRTIDQTSRQPMDEEDEVLIEVEAVESVYGDDCLVLRRFPPHLQVHIRPRTADVSSQQFVEATIGIRAGPQYPDTPPEVDLIEHKGLDDQRQKHLVTDIQERAHQLSSCLMLVALCEEAVEKLSAMNHPDGNCPLCLYPLVPEDEVNETLPFMKLMSCFHCFHSECFFRWWNWIQNERENCESMYDEKGSEVSEGNCPVCRKVFQTRDIEHVLDLVGSYSSKLSFEEGDLGKFDELHLDSENIRRQKFEAILKLQQERNGLIEPRKDLVVMPGMFLPQSLTSSSSSSSSSGPMKETSEVENLETNQCCSPKQQRDRSSANVHSTGEHRKFGARRHRGQNARKQTRHWVMKEDHNAG